MGGGVNHTNVDFNGRWGLARKDVDYLMVKEQVGLDVNEQPLKVEERIFKS